MGFLVEKSIKQKIKEEYQSIQDSRIETKAWGIVDLDDDKYFPNFKDPSICKEWDGYAEYDLLPKIVVYLRTSKKSTLETNVLSQERCLIKLFKFFKTAYHYKRPNEWLFNERIIVEQDIDESGSKINEGLNRLLDQLSFEDLILVQDVSRLSRMNTLSDEFKSLHQRLYAQGRMVYMLGLDGRPLLIDKSVFPVLARASNEEYEFLRKSSIKGNLKKSEMKAELKRLTAELYNQYSSDIGFIAHHLKRGKSTIYKYIKELVEEGVIINVIDKRKIKLNSPVEHATVAQYWE